MTLDWKQLLLESERAHDFDIANDVLSELVIRRSDTEGHFYYFYHSGDKRLIKNFRLRDGPLVDTLCAVILTTTDEKGFKPRLRFWKRDKTRAKPDEPTAEDMLATGETLLAKALVDLSDCHESFWKLVDFLRSYEDLDVPEHDFRITSADDVALARSLEGHDKRSVLAAVKTHLEGQISEHDVQMLVDRKETLTRFASMLTDVTAFEAERSRTGKTRKEDVWQRFFEENSWIFGYGLTLVACEGLSDERLEQMTTGANLFRGAGKRIDVAMRTRGFIQSLLFGEIKHHDTDLLKATPYRKPDVYQVSKELSGAVSQVQKTAHKAIKQLEDIHRQRNQTGDFEFEVSTIKPRQVVVLGNLSQLATDDQINLEKLTSFELYRRNQQEIEILTFDELLARARFIVQSQQPD